MILHQADVVDPVCMRLDLLPKDSGRTRSRLGRSIFRDGYGRGSVGEGVEIEVQVPGTYDAVSASGIAMRARSATIHCPATDQVATC